MANDQIANTGAALRSVEDVQRLAGLIRDNVQRIIVGKTDSIDLVLAALLSRGHVLVEDVPGTGKTTLAKAIAASLRCEFQRLQFTPDLVPADVLGVNVYDPQNNAFEFRPGPIFTQVFLADEINRATPRTQSALLEAMQEKQISIDGVTTPLSSPFIVLATLNPIEMEGTFPLPEAQLDRFMLRVSLGYPSQAEEAEMLDRFRANPDPEMLAPVVEPGGIVAAQRLVATVHVDDSVRDYILAIVEATRSHQQLRLGASPRASLALQHTAQARAAMAGRDYVMPDDIKALAPSVLSHRLIGDMSAQLRGINRRRIVTDIVSNIPVPIER